MKPRCTPIRNPPTIWQFGQLLLLAFLFPFQTAAQVPGLKGKMSATVAHGSQASSTAEVDRAIALAATYLERACGPDGQFAYRVDVNFGEQDAPYNVVRHAGAMYALAMVRKTVPDDQSLDAMLRAASLLRRDYIAPGERPDQLVVWSQPSLNKSAADLGATGLGLVAFADLETAKPDSIPLQQLQAMGRFLLFLQRSDGGFISKYRAGSGPMDNFQSLYYPGEAALGLISLYEIDHDPVWLNAAARALSFLARNRASLSDVPLDHWAMIATAKLLPYYAQSASPATRDELVRHATQICEAMIRDQLRNPANPALDGSFGSMGRTSPTATRMEGLLAALEFLPDGALRTQVKECVDHGIAFLLRAQVRDGAYAGGMPGGVLPDAYGGSDIRIDFVQHALCAWLRYKAMFQTSDQDAPPISGKDPNHIRILFGGDTDFGESYQEKYAREGKGNILVEKGYQYSVANLYSLLKSVDYRILNLETPLTLRRVSSPNSREYVHYSDPVKAPRALSGYGPIAYSLANNHAMDQDPAGLVDTRNALESAGARYFGAGGNIAEASRPLIQTFRIADRSFTVAVFGGLEFDAQYAAQGHDYADATHPGVASIDVAGVERAIRDLRARTPDAFVIYFMHVLQNYTWKTPEQTAMAAALRNAGVDLVIGCGAHRMQEVEYDDKQWTFYGLGNFIFNAGGRYSTFHAPPYSLPLVIDFSLDHGRLITAFRDYPILSDNTITNYQPRFVNDSELNTIYDLLKKQSRWGAAADDQIKRGEDSIASYIGFSSSGLTSHVGSQAAPFYFPRDSNRRSIPSIVNAATTDVIINRLLRPPPWHLVSSKERCLTIRTKSSTLRVR